ncbi:coiled-coil domain-containing protein 90B, mitochondrial isoform X3 [Pristis pectinata]|uniref:coiled-coil domain-containing protein 90B, mitochondrial isoform X3 n=1 Tax=Pristis pectinata TaxID=685728 RepID=UPI00223DCDC9|nr:coiled-coil domain-containing protein 90B, mitochondrial isoform X3 [Pristis pectinata]
MKLIQRCKTLLQAYNFRAVDLHHSLAENPRTHLKRGFFAATSSCAYDTRVELFSQEQRRMCFDTHALVLELQNNGFPKEQAEAIVTLLANVTCANMESTYKDLVTKAQQKIKIELEHVKQQLMDEVKKIRNDTKLDMNLEKSRIMDSFREQEKQLMTSKNEFTELNSDTDRAITETNKKIDTDVASLKTMLESLKLETMRYLAGYRWPCICCPSLVASGLSGLLGHFVAN